MREMKIVVLLWKIVAFCVPIPSPLQSTIFIGSKKLLRDSVGRSRVRLSIPFLLEYGEHLQKALQT